MNIEELKAAASAATLEPWTLNGGDDVVIGSVTFWAGCPEDAAHIVAANPAAILELIAAYEAAEKRITLLAGGFQAAKSLAAHNQAKIDSLMLEYCPGEMTQEQEATWAAHQKPPTNPDLIAALKADK